MRNQTLLVSVLCLFLGLSCKSKVSMMAYNQSNNQYQIQKKESLKTDFDVVLIDRIIPKTEKAQEKNIPKRC